MNQSAVGKKNQLSPTALFSYGVRLIYYFLQSSMLLIALATVLITLVICSPVVFTTLFENNFDPTKPFDLFYLITYNLVFFFIIPVIYNKLFYQQSFNQIGVQLPENKSRALLLVLLALAIVIPAVVYLNTNKQFHDFYTLALRNHSLDKILFLQFIILPLYYFSEEFFFRGFLLLNLSKKLGWHSLWITDIFFVCAHAGKPLVEIMFSIPSGIILACLTMATRSIYPAIMLHYCIGLTIVLVITQS